MDWYPLFNSLRIAALSSIIVFFRRHCRSLLCGTPAAPCQRRARRGAHAAACAATHGRGLFSAIAVRFPPSLGIALEQIGVKFVMTWYGGVIAASVVAFPLLYRTARGAFEAFDQTLAQAGRTLGLSNTYIFWRIRMPSCRQGIIAGVVLAFGACTGRIRRDQHADRLHARQKPRPSRPQCTSSGARATIIMPFSGCWSTLRSPRRCC